MERRYGYGLGIVLAGGLVATVQAVHGLQQTDTVLVFTFEAGPFVLVGLALAYVGLWLARNEEVEPDLERILAWGVGSTLLFASVAALMLFSQRVSMGTLDRSTFIAMDLVTVGAVVGLLVGLYDARGQRRLRELERQRDRVESFANKAADVNNYGWALNQSTSVDEVSALCIQAMQALLGLSEVAIVAVTAEDTEPIDNTILDVTTEDLAALASTAREYERASVESHDRPPGNFAAEGETALSILLTERAEEAVVALAVVPAGMAFEEEDVQLMELLTSHAGTALDGIYASAGPVESSTGP